MIMGPLLMRPHIMINLIIDEVGARSPGDSKLGLLEIGVCSYRRRVHNFLQILNIPWCFQCRWRQKKISLYEFVFFFVF